MALLGGLGLFGIALLLVAVAHYRRDKPKEWRYVAFLAFCGFPLIFLGTALHANLTEMKEVEFCSTCHVMERYVESLTYDDDEPLSSVHYRNNYVPQESACYSCHTSYAMFGGLQAKTNGLRHVIAYVRGIEADDIELYKPYSNDNCLHCHGPSERFQKAKKHTEKENFLADSESGELSCLKAGCHDLGHYWESEEEDDEDW